MSSVCLLLHAWCIQFILNTSTVVPALGDHRRERPPAVCGHLINVPTHFNVKLPPISGHLPNADADSHLLVVSTCYNGQCKQMPRFRLSFQTKIAGALFYVIAASWLRSFYDITSQKSRILFFNPRCRRRERFSVRVWISEYRCCAVWTKHIV